MRLQSCFDLSSFKVNEVGNQSHDQMPFCRIYRVSKVALAIRDLKKETLKKNKRSNWPCVLKLCAFLSRPMQNNNLKSPQLASSAKRSRDSKFF